MRAVLKSNNPVVLSYATHVLEESGIDGADIRYPCQHHGWQHGMVPRRLMVADEDFAARRSVCLPRSRSPEAAPCALSARSGETDFLNGRVIVRQPERGFRAGLDAVMLAAAVPRVGATALELGAGAGTASLCLAARLPAITITGIEIDPELVRAGQRQRRRQRHAEPRAFRRRRHLRPAAGIQARI